jgi:DNA-binding beta-propeller fold protein YncE/mono/diheme cytochrome c family protein
MRRYLWMTSTARAARVPLVITAVLAVATAALLANARPVSTEKAPYRSPFDVAFSPNGKTLAVSDQTGNSLALVDAATRKVLRQVVLAAPAGLAWSGNRLYAAESGGRSVAEIDTTAGKVLRRLKVSPRPLGVAVAPKRGLLVAMGWATDRVTVVDLKTGKARATVRLPGMPAYAAVTPDESLAVLTTYLPGGNASDPSNAACITQLERGWINTNALSIIDLKARQVYATVLLDHPSEGAADPWGVAITKDGKTLWVSLSGVHQVAKIHLARLLPMLAGEKPPAGTPAAAVAPSPEYSLSTQSVWLEIQKDPKQRELLVNDLAALHAAELIEKFPVPGKGPRGIDLSPDGSRLAVAAYYAEKAVLLNPTTGKQSGSVALAPARKPDPVRQGEINFHDATLCFQHWLSCASCHPQGRADGLNWDLLNDGLGNPKNTKSLLLSHRTPPAMWHGVRANADVAIAAGFRYIQFHEPTEEELATTRAFVRAMRPLPSPYSTAKGELTPQAKRGKAIFESAKTRCASCHSGPLYTDQKLYDVGTRGPLDHDGKFDTPTLVELWRTAPYLHDGSATTLQAVIRNNKGDKHGVTSHLTKQQVDDLVAYLLSL